MLLLCSRVGSYLISDTDGRGRVFDGIGAVSGGSVSIMLLLIIMDINFLN